MELELPYERLQKKVLRVISKQKKALYPNTLAEKKPTSKKRRIESITNQDTQQQRKVQRTQNVKTGNAQALIDKPVIGAGSENNQYNNDRTVYIQGLPFSATDEEIHSFFEPCGEIISVRLPKWHDTGRIKGYGHVEFKDSRSAIAALDMSGQYIKDRYISVDRPQNPRALQSTTADPKISKEIVKSKPVGCRRIFIKNLPYDITEGEIRESFMVFGPINTVRLALWNHTGNLKGFGYIDFKREDSADIAVRKCSTGTVTVKGRVVAADYETKEPKGSFKGGQV